MSIDINNYINTIQNGWGSLHKLPKLTQEQIKSIDNDNFRMYFYCYYGYPEFKLYKKKKLLKRYIDKEKK